MKKIKMIIIILLLICIASQVFHTDHYVKAKTNIFTDNEYDYTVTKPATKTVNGTVSIRGNIQSNLSSSTITIPATVKRLGYTYQVESIGENAFSNWQSLKKVVIPNNITSIEAYAFFNCVKLTTIVIPDNITHININSFYSCNSDLTIYCSYGSCAYYYAKSNNIKYKISNNKKTDMDNRKKLIIVGDSRSNNMHKWVKTSVPTEFIAKSQMGFRWFEEDAIDQVNAIINKGDIIVVWLGVNDYYSNNLGGDTWTVYASKLNSLASNEWSNCKLYVAAVGYVDRAKHYAYYGKDIRSNVTQLIYVSPIHGITEFNQKLKASLSSKITWIDTDKVIGIPEDDTTVTQDNIWCTRANGKKDGLHYSKLKTQEIYNNFVQETMSN